MFEERIADALERIAAALEAKPERPAERPSLFKQQRRENAERAAGLYETGLTLPEVAAAMGVHSNTVSAWLRTIGVQVNKGPRKYASSIDGEKAAVLYNEGKSLLEIAAYFGAGAPDTIRRALVAQGAQIRGRGVCQKAGWESHNQERVARIREMREQGHTLEEIGQELHITRERVRQLCVRAGIDTSERPLSPAQLAAVDEYVRGDSLEQVGNRAGVSPYTLRGWIAKAGYQVRPRVAHARVRPETWANAKIAARLYGEGKTIEQIRISLGLNCAGGMIYRLLGLAGVKPNRTKTRKEINAAI